MTQKEKEKNKCENVGTTSAQDGHDGGGGGQRVYLVPTLHRQKFQGRTSSFNKKTYVLLLKALNGSIVASHGGGGSYEHGHGHMVAWVFVVGFIHNINSCTQVQASLYLMEVVGDGGEAITPPFPIVLPKKLRCFRNKRTTCQRFSSKQTCEETNVERWGDDKCKRWI